jgi:hypothetical protein
MRGKSVKETSGEVCAIRLEIGGVLPQKPPKCGNVRNCVKTKLFCAIPGFPLSSSVSC